MVNPKIVSEAVRQKSHSTDITFIAFNTLILLSLFYYVYGTRWTSETYYKNDNNFIGSGLWQKAVGSKENSAQPFPKTYYWPDKFWPIISFCSFFYSWEWPWTKVDSPRQTKSLSLLLSAANGRIKTFADQLLICVAAFYIPRNCYYELK